MKKFTFKGKSQSLPAWGRELGIPESTLRSRLTKLGMTVEEAFTRPIDKRFQPDPEPERQVRPAPRLRRDKRGRAIARWTDCGRRKVKIFGMWGQQESIKSYNRWAAEWHANQSTPPSGGKISVAFLILSCLDWAESHYRKHGKKTSEVYGFRAALAAVADLYGETPADEFTPTRLRAVQARWVEEGKVIKTCNDYLGRVVRCWSWGVSRDLVPAAAADALAHVPRLVRGRTLALASEDVTGVPDRDFEKVLPKLHKNPERCRILAAVARLQRVSGMRPGEVLELVPENLDRSAVPWRYEPVSGGKTYHLDKDRRVFIGPQGRAILEPFLAAAKPGQHVFRLTRRRGKGVLPIRIEYYRAKIAEACEAVGVPVFKPNQIRHSKANEVHKKYEDDKAVAAALGNSPEVARQVYVDNPADAVAKRIAEELG